MYQPWVGYRTFGEFEVFGYFIDIRRYYIITTVKNGVFLFFTWQKIKNSGD